MGSGVQEAANGKCGRPEERGSESRRIGPEPRELRERPDLSEEPAGRSAYFPDRPQERRARISRGPTTPSRNGAGAASRRFELQVNVTGAVTAPAPAVPAPAVRP